MAKPKNLESLPNPKWIAHRYKDHAGRPAVLMKEEATNPKAKEMDYPPIPPFAVQVYSTIPLDSDHDLLCMYLSKGAATWPRVSFEIYEPQPDVWACVDHQRREIHHRKQASPGEPFFPGIAKANLDSLDWSLQGFLVVITSHSYRDAVKPSFGYEDESGPLWVNFDRCFPPKAEVNNVSRYARLPVPGSEATLPMEFCSSSSPEREEIMVTKCRDVSARLGILGQLPDQSHEDDVYFYGFDEDEGDPSSLDEQPSPEVIESLRKKSDSLSDSDFTIQSLPESGVTIRSKAAQTETDLQYVIHVSFPHSGLDLITIARAFTAGLLENFRFHQKSKTVNFQFHTSASRHLGFILDSHQDIMASHPDMTIGRLPPADWASKSGLAPGTRIFSQDRCQESEDWIDTKWRKPYRTFIVILDRADFLTGPGILYFLTDGNELTERWFQAFEKTNPVGPIYPKGDTCDYAVWRSLGMREVADRLAMLSVGGGEMIDGPWWEGTI